MSSTGSNKLEDLWKSRGTHRLNPLSGVTDKGGIVTAAATGGVVTVSYTSAKVVLDSLPYNLAAGTVVTPALQNGQNEINVYVTPVRKVPAVTNLPPTSTIGNLAMLVGPADANNQYLSGLYIYTATGWVLRDRFVEGNLDPNKPDLPRDFLIGSTSDFRHLPFNEITAATVSLSDEPAVLYPPNAGMPANLPGMGPSYARFTTTFVLATIDVKLTGGAIATPSDVTIRRPKSVDLF